MNGYKINEKDIEIVLRRLRAKDPENANREHAIHKLMAMNELAKELANQDLEFAELLEKALSTEPDPNPDRSGEANAHPADDLSTKD